MDYGYLIAPVGAWFCAGIIKFCINSIRAGELSFKLIGYGGLPSNHSAIVSSTAALIGLREGIGHAAFGVAITLAFIVMLDASSLRRQVGKHAIAINKLSIHSDGRAVLRERMGHSPLEIAAGIVTGVLVAFVIQYLLPR